MRVEVRKIGGGPPPDVLNAVVGRTQHPILASMVDTSPTYDILGVLGADEKQNRELNPSLLSAITGGITDGTSLSGTNMGELINTLDHRNVVGMEVDNFCKWAMVSPVTFVEGGVITLSPREIHPGQREALLARKTSFTATGSYGTVSWLIDGRRVIVMWDDPFNFDFYSNTLAVGIIGPNEHTSSMYDKMYKGFGNFTRAEYDGGTRTIEYCDNELCVHGTMGTSHRTEVHIQVIPINLDNISPSLEAYIPSVDNIIGK